MAGEVRFIRTNTAGIRELLTNRSTSDVAQFLSTFTDHVRQEAIRLCPRRDPTASPRTEFSGPLSATITTQQNVSGEFSIFLVGSTDPRAFWVHEGTDPHRISGQPVLRFYWKRAGKVITVRSVSHPGISTSPAGGNKGAQRFLSQALENISQRELGASSGTLLGTGSLL